MQFDILINVGCIYIGDILINVVRPVLTHPVPTHMPCCASHLRPTHACICPHTNPRKCPGMFPFSARLYVQCWPICHAVCNVAHLRPTRAMRPMPAHGPICATARVGSNTICNTPPTKAAPPNPSEGRGRVHIGSTLIPFVTPLPPKPHNPALPRGGHTYT
jgi:hypothetical protein